MKVILQLLDNDVVVFTRGDVTVVVAYGAVVEIGVEIVFGTKGVQNDLFYHLTSSAASGRALEYNLAIFKRTVYIAPIVVGIGNELIAFGYFGK